MNDLYKSWDVQWYRGEPFQTVEVTDYGYATVRFNTEWPVRQLQWSRADFDRKFYKM